MKPREFHRFLIPIYYGLATANFIAVIQLVSTPRVQFDFNLFKIGPLTPEAEMLFAGFSGMTLMIVSVPILVGYALYTEIKIKLGRVDSIKFSFGSIFLLGIGVAGLACTLHSFHTVFGNAFMISALTTGAVVGVALNRLEK